MLRAHAALLATLTFVLPAAAAPLANCAGPVEKAGGHTLRVEKNGTMILADGRTLYLEGIRLPDGAFDRAPQTFAEQALTAIRAMSGSAPLALTSMPPENDRYGRLRVQAFVAGAWLQEALLERGLVRVSIAPDRTECAAELFAAEAKARTARVGLWTAPAYQVRSPENVWRDVGTFQIVEGKVLNASMRKARAYLNFGSDWRRDFTVTVDPDDMRNFRRAGVDPLSYSGQIIRVRGWVQSMNGPEIEVPNPQGIEVVQ